ncbi:Caleosin related protein-domain containing protein [Rhodotorula toruloides]|uniref:Caleosin related protein-domain containing protein n=1 Tax=Rhodotorula toruloides TaxID=5286 RepID=A0A2S9ZYW2_RHOTO|nr:Caleosin related protein-domain containing protein [Rhodotorula toruloides]PRQ70949.1 Caleosin related protein-domain containing protein [Rhodotorula toruloides]
MSPSYAQATSAWLPSDPPQPDKALLATKEEVTVGKHQHSPSTIGQDSQKVVVVAQGQGQGELTPPLTPPGEKEDSIAAAEGVRRRKVGKSLEEEDDDVPGKGFVQSLPGTVSAERYVPEDLDKRIYKPWVPRANIAATPEHPYGTTAGGYAEKHKDEPVLAQHVAFFDKDRDNILWPLDTWRGFREMGYSFFWCTFAMCVIHFFFSWFTTPNRILPDPFFRVYISNGHRSKHGSDTAVFDSEGRFIPAKFEEIFTKFDKGNKGGLTFREGVQLIHAQRQAVDPIGVAAECFEWASTYLLIWPKDGICDKESIRTVYDGSLFYLVADAERQRSQARLAARKKMGWLEWCVDSVPGPWRGWGKENKAGNFEWRGEVF